MHTNKQHTLYCAHHMPTLRRRTRARSSCNNPLNLNWLPKYSISRNPNFLSVVTNHGSTNVSFVPCCACCCCFGSPLVAVLSFFLFSPPPSSTSHVYLCLGMQGCATTNNTNVHHTPPKPHALRTTHPHVPCHPFVLYFHESYLWCATTPGELLDKLHGPLLPYRQHALPCCNPLLLCCSILCAAAGSGYLTTTALCSLCKQAGR